MRVGYRQAKAGFVVRTAGVARFAGPGAVPLGVIRTGSLVVVRPRALRAVGPGAVRAGCLADKVAQPLEDPDPPYRDESRRGRVSPPAVLLPVNGGSPSTPPAA